MIVWFSGKRSMAFGIVVCIMMGLWAEPSNNNDKLDRHLDDGDTPLLAAISAGDTDAVRRLLDAGASPDFSSERGDLPVFALFRDMPNEPGRLEILKLLVGHGVSVNSIDQGNGARETLLMKAAQEGCLDAFVWLLDAGSDTDARDAYGYGLLSYIYESGNDGRHLSFLSELRKRGYDLGAHFLTADGAYVLRQICENRLLGDLEYLRDSGVPLGNVSLNDQNALFWFTTCYANDNESLKDVSAVQVEMAKLLVKAGCNASVSDKDGNTPLRLACDRRNFSLARYVRWREKKEHPSPDYFSSAYLSGCLSAALSWNIEEEKTAVFRAMLVDFLDDGMNPSDVLYDVCRITESADLTGLLLERGANPDASDGSGRTSLMDAVNHEILNLLIGAKARVDPCDNEGRTALHYAALQGSAGKTRLLLAHGADINAASTNGETPFSVAVTSGNGELALMLLKAGADPSVRFEKNKNALAYIVANEYESVSDFAALCLVLLEKGLRADEKDNEGKSVLYYLALNPEVCPTDLRARLKASVDATAVAEAEAQVATERRDEKRSDTKEKIRDTAVALAFPLLLSGLSIATREGIYSGDPSANWMVNVNAVFGMGMMCGIGGGLLGYIIDKNTGYGSGGFLDLPVFTILGVLGGTLVGIFMPLNQNVREAFRNNAALYYLPTVAVDFVALWRVVDILR